MKPIVAINNLEKCYRGVPVLHQLSLFIQQGEVFAILGKNGAGKSTLFKLLAGLIEPTDGTIQILDAKPTDLMIKRKIGVTINEPVFYEQLTGWKNLEIHAAYYDVNTAKLALAFERVGLNPKNHLPVSQYSLGMRQRLAIARMLLPNPEILIIDEPLNGLDPKAIRDFRELLHELANEGTTIILSSHILSEVQHIASTIAVLYEGAIIAKKSTQEWLQLEGTSFENKMINLMEGTACINY
ncbi:ABC transporter ATP-binding protein [Enterococcus ratti]|uniref:ABC transporter ATP-binding protein n=1 Tax=Enterococcus ratti TaxID=150033 RepID=UPI003512D01C